MLFIGGVAAAFVAREVRRRILHSFATVDEHHNILKEKEVEKAWLEAEDSRKTIELEEARTLQLSMLPDVIPTVAGLDIQVYMQTATEVGGDYYDFSVTDDGALTIAIGDATGHGLHAGTMVAITKGLFKALGQGSSPLTFLRKSTHILKGMNLRRHYMAMTLARYQDHRLQLAAAGMPMPWVYRSATRDIEEIEVKGMPLGSFVQFPYQQKEISLGVGDTVLLMSDGFPELFNPDGDMLGYSGARSSFEAVSDRTPSEIIAHLKGTVTAWGNGHIQDDITFVVMQVRP